MLETCFAIGVRLAAGVKNLDAPSTDVVSFLVSTAPLREVSLINNETGFVEVELAFTKALCCGPLEVIGVEDLTLGMNEVCRVDPNSKFP